MLQNYSNMMMRGGGGGSQQDHPRSDSENKDWKGPSWC